MGDPRVPALLSAPRRSASSASAPGGSAAPAGALPASREGGGGHGRPPGRPERPPGPLWLTDAQQRTVARCALVAATDLVETASLWPDAAVFVSLTTGPIFDRIEGAMVMLRGAPAELRERALALQQEIEVCHQLLILSVLFKIRGRARAARDQAARAGRSVGLNELLATAIIGAHRGVRHFDPDELRPLWKPVCAWTLKALEEEARNSGPLRVSESAIEDARAVRAGRVDPNSQRGIDTAAIWGGRDAMRDSLDHELANVVGPDGDAESALGCAQALDCALGWLEDFDPWAAYAVRLELGVGAKVPAGGDRIDANLSKGDAAALVKLAAQRGLAWLRWRLRGAREVVRAPADAMDEITDDDGARERLSKRADREERRADRQRFGAELTQFLPSSGPAPTHPMSPLVM